MYVGERRKIIDYSVLAMGQGKNTPGFIGIRLEFSDGTRTIKGFMWGKNRDKFRFPETLNENDPGDPSSSREIE